MSPAGEIYTLAVCFIHFKITKSFPGNNVVVKHSNDSRVNLNTIERETLYWLLGLILR